MLDHVVPPQHVHHVHSFLVCHIQTRKVGSSTEPTDGLLNKAVSRQLYKNALIRTKPSYFFEYLKLVVKVEQIFPGLFS